MSSPPRTQPRLALAAITVLAPLLYFHRATFSEKIFIARDILRVYYPLKKYWAERVSQLQWPDWYPYDGVGQPFTGMVISGAFHPSNLLYLVLPLGTALKVITLLSYVVALAGTYRFARLWSLSRGAALLAGFTYALGGYMVDISNNQLYLMAAATFPWALEGAERFLRRPGPGRAAAAVLPLCLVLLSGDPQSFAVCNGLLLVLALVRPGEVRGARALPRVGVLIVLGALLSAVQLVPALNVLHEGKANAGSLRMATTFSLHPLRLIELPLGPVFSDPEVGAVSSPALANEVLDSGSGSLWVSSVHLGAVAVLLLLAALRAHGRRRLTWQVTGIALGMLVLALGRALPFYGWLYSALPLWRSFRYPEKLLPYFVFLCALGAGVGLDATQRDSTVRRWTLRMGLGFAALWGALALAEGVFQAFSQGVVAASWRQPETYVLEYIQGNVIHLGLLAAGACLLASAVLAGVDKPGLRAGLLAAVQLGSLYLANEDTYHVSYGDVLEQPVAMVDLLLKLEPDTGMGRPRVLSAAEGIVPAEVPGVSPVDSAFLTLTAALMPDTPALWGLESANPYLPASSRRYDSLLPHTLPEWQRLGHLFHVRYTTVNARVWHGPEEQVLTRDSLLGLALLQDRLALPRAYLAAPLCVPDEDTARRRLLAGDFQPGRQVIVECPGNEPTEAPLAEGEPGHVRWLRSAPEDVGLEVQASRPSVLVLNDGYYRGWSATLDGAEVPILPAQVAVRGVRVPEGTHRVEFTYRTPGRTLSEVLSVGTLGVLGLALLVERRRAWARSASPGGDISI